MARQLDRKKSKQFHWVTLADTLCTQPLLDCKGCCEDAELPDLGRIRGCTYDQQGDVTSSNPQPWPLVLLSPVAGVDNVVDMLQQTDVFTIVRLQGWLELCPYFCPSSEEVAQCLSDPQRCQVFAHYAKQFDNYHLRAGLTKDRWEWDPLQQTYSVPTRYPMDPHEWSDAQFMRTWERFKARKPATEGLTLDGSAALGCCGDVSSAGAGAPANTLSSGSGTVNIPAISTDCEPCIGDPENNFRGTDSSFSQFGCFRLNLNSKRRLVLRENEGLTLWMDWTSFTPGIAPDDGWRRNVGMGWRAGVKALLEV